MRELVSQQAPQQQWSAVVRIAVAFPGISAHHLGAIADNARDLDFAMRWGFGWAQGPFETWQAAGWKQIADWVKDDIDAGEALSKTPLPAWVFDGPVAKAGGVHTKDGSWSP